MRWQRVGHSFQKPVRRKIKIASIGLLLVLGIWILMVGIPWGIQAFTVLQLEKMTGHDVTIEDVSLHYIDRRVTLTGFELKNPESKESLVTIDQLQIQFRLWALLNKHITLPAVVVDHPVVSVIREGDGTLNVSRLRQEDSSSSEPSEFVTIVQDFKLNNGTVLYQDFTIPAHPQARIDGISLDVSDFSTKGQEPFPFAFQGTLAEKGVVVAKGQVHMDPFSLKSEWDIQQVHLSPYRDFISGIPAISGIVKSSFNLEFPTESFSQVGITGNLTVDDVRVGTDPNPFLTGQQIIVSDVDFAAPDRLLISRVMVRKPSLEIVRDEQGTLPVLAHVQAKNPQTSPSTGNQSGMTPMIGEIQLQDGRMRFIDKTTQPEYRKELTRMIVDITQPAGTGQMGHVNVTASTLDEETIAMEGDIRLFGGDFYLDVDGKVKKFSIPSVNPYAEKFLGWGTRSGQLTTDIHVHIEEQHLRSKSKIGISDLRVVRAGSDDPVKKTLGLPLGLVVDLIKNINGDIKLKIEVEGPLNKPEFSIRDAILKSLRNAIVNIVTAPLRLIGSLVKGGNSKIQKIDIHPILFKSGTNIMAEGMEERVKHLQTFLKKTPYIGLEVQPTMSAGDVHMLRIRAVASRIAELETQQSLSRDLEAAQALYQEKFPDKSIPDEEVALLEELVAHEPDPGERAAVLALERASMVIDRLTSSQSISPDRFHLDAVKESSNEEGLGGLEFSIR